jgi:hypothetical protein
MTNQISLLEQASLTPLANTFEPGQTVMVSDRLALAIILKPVRNGGERATVLRSEGDYCVVRIVRTLSTYGTTYRGSGLERVPASVSHTFDLQIHRSYLLALQDQGKIIDQ